MGVKKALKITKSLADTISGVIPNLLNIQVKIEGAEYDPKRKVFLVNEVIINFNLGNKK